MNLAKYKEKNDEITLEQLRIVQFSMGPNAIEEELVDGTKAIVKLQNKLFSKYVGQNVIRGQLRIMVKATLKLYYQLNAKGACTVVS